MTEYVVKKVEVVRVVGSDRFVQNAHESDRKLTEALVQVALGHLNAYKDRVNRMHVIFDTGDEIDVKIDIVEKEVPVPMTMEHIVELIELMEKDPDVESDYLNIRFNQYHKAPESLKNLWAAISQMKRDRRKDYWKMFALLPKHGFATKSYDLNGDLPVHCIMTRKGPFEYTI